MRGSLPDFPHRQFYLNYVGYKQDVVGSGQSHQLQFYLNYVGYKLASILFPWIRRYSFI